MVIRVCVYLFTNKTDRVWIKVGDDGLIICQGGISKQIKKKNPEITIRVLIKY